MAKTVAIIVAAGRGERAGADAPKQYRPIAGKPMLTWSAEAFARHPLVEKTVVVIGAGQEAAFERAAVGLDLGAPVVGGAARQASVRAGLEALAGAPPEIVLIHDAARPFLPQAVIDRALQAIADGADGACASLPAVDTMRRAEDGLCGELVSRDGVWRAQTPQAFRYQAILEAHRRVSGEAFTDDAEIARAAGLRVAVTLGDAANAKITTPEDFDWAERWMRGALVEETRVGQGFDVHAFGPNADGSSDHVMLCGVRVPHEDGLKAHSDGDVGLHAATDAIMGAAALGDIGRHFPPTDPAFKGMDSAIFLEKALELARAQGARLAALDVTLICERPKIAPHSEEMRARLAGICGVGLGRISVKATTTEKLGFTGRREGIAAMATATLAMRLADEERA